MRKISAALLFFMLFIAVNIGNSQTLPTLKIQWKANLGQWSGMGSPALADVNLDGITDVVIGSYDGKIYVFSGDNGSAVAGWPQATGTSIASSPAVGDVDGDGYPEIVCGLGLSDKPNENGGIVVYEHNGTLKFKVSPLDLDMNGFSDGVSSTPALGDINGDGILDIIIGSFDHQIYVLSGDGKAYEYNAEGNLVNKNINAPTIFKASLYRKDTDNDGRWDEDPLGDMTPMVFSPGIPGDGKPGFSGVDDDGDGLTDEGHPHDDDEDSFNPGDKVVNQAKVNEDDWDFPVRSPDTIWSSSAIVDLNSDGIDDFIIASDVTIDNKGYGLLWAVNGKAEIFGSFPQTTKLSNRIWTGLSVADVDKDGIMEIFSGTSNQDGNFIYGFKANGQEIRDGDGNPATFGVFATTPGPVFSTPAIGDLDGDGDLEIVVSVFYNRGDNNSPVYAWHHDGSLVSGFPAYTWNSPGMLSSSPAIGDINGDNMPDIMVGSGGLLMAWDNQGRQIITPANNVLDTGLIISSPAIADIDNDGKVEIIIATDSKSGGSPKPGDLYCIEAGTYNPSTMYWQMLKHDSKRSGRYRPPASAVFGEGWGTQNNWECITPTGNPAPTSVAQWDTEHIICKWLTSPLPAPGFYQWIKWNPSHTGIQMDVPYISDSIYVLKTRMIADSNETVPHIRARVQSSDNNWSACAVFGGDPNIGHGGVPSTNITDLYMLWQPQGTRAPAFVAFDIYNASPNLGEISVEDWLVYRLNMPTLTKTEKVITNFSSGWNTLGWMSNVSIGSQISIADTSTWSTAGAYITLSSPITPLKVYSIKYSLSKTGSNLPDIFRLRCSDIANASYNSYMALFQDIVSSPSQFTHYHIGMNGREPTLGDLGVFLDTVEFTSSASTITLSKIIIESFSLPTLN